MELLNGFTNLKDVVNERVVGDLIPVVTEAVDQSVAEHNDQFNALSGLLIQKTTKHQVRYKTPGAAKLMGLDEHGRARKIKSAGQYDVGFPLRDAGLAHGDTRIALVKKTVQEVNNTVTSLLQADLRWNLDQMLAALFDNAGYTFSDPEFGDVAVKGLANGDSTKYLIRAGASDGETANHYRFISAMDDANHNFSDIFRDLAKRPENFGGGNVISLIPTNLEDDVMGLAGFIEQTDPDIALGANTDKLIGSLDARVPGEVIGKVSRNWIARWDALPDDYVISIITSGARPIAMREHAEAELQGFNRVADRNDDPFYESQYVRHAGYGGWNRVAAIVTKVGAGSYSVPTGFSQPMN